MPLRSRCIEAEPRTAARVSVSKVERVAQVHDRIGCCLELRSSSRGDAVSELGMNRWRWTYSEETDAIGWRRGSTGEHEIGEAWAAFELSLNT